MNKFIFHQQVGSQAGIFITFFFVGMNFISDFYVMTNKARKNFATETHGLKARVYVNPVDIDDYIVEVFYE